MPPGWDEFPEPPQPADLAITKKQWGAFYGTELDLQLRRRGIRCIVLGGIATNILPRLARVTTSEAITLG